MFILLTVSFLSRNSSHSFSRLSIRTDDEEVGLSSLMLLLRLLGIDRPYQSVFTAPLYVPPLRFSESYPTYSVTADATMPFSTSSRASVSAISLMMTRAFSKGYGSIRTCPWETEVEDGL